MGMDHPAAEAEHDRREAEKKRQESLARDQRIAHELYLSSESLRVPTIYLPIIKQTQVTSLKNSINFSEEAPDCAQLIVWQNEAIRTKNLKKFTLLLGMRSVDKIIAQTIYNEEISLFLHLYRLTLEKTRAIFMQVQSTLNEDEAVRVVTKRDHPTADKIRLSLFQAILALQKSHGIITTTFVSSLFHKNSYKCSLIEIVDNVYQHLAQRLPYSGLATYYQENPPETIEPSDIHCLLQCMLSNEYFGEINSYFGRYPNERRILAPFLHINNNKHVIEPSLITLILKQYEEANSLIKKWALSFLEEILERSHFSFNLTMLAKFRGDWEILVVIFQHYIPQSSHDRMIQQTLLAYCRERKRMLRDWDKLAYLATTIGNSSLENSFAEDDFLINNRMDEASFLLETINSRFYPSKKIKAFVSNDNIPQKVVVNPIFKDECAEAEIEKYGLKRHGLHFARRIYNEEVDLIKKRRQTCSLEPITTEELNLVQGNFVTKLNEAPEYQTFLQIFSKKFPDEAAFMQPESLKNKDLVDEQGNASKIFELASNRYHLMILQCELQRIQEKLPKKRRRTILTSITEEVEEELKKSSHIQLVSALTYVRKAYETLGENAQSNFQKELSQWHKETYPRVSHLPNRRGLAKSASAIAYIYQDYLRWGEINLLNLSPVFLLEIFGLKSHEEYLEFFEQSENMDKAKVLYQCFTQHRPLFEGYYIEQRSYQEKWNTVLQREIIQVLLITSKDISRSFDEPDFVGLDNVLVQQELLCVIDNFSELAKREGEKTNSILITQLISYQKVLLCYQEKFFNNSSFFDVFFHKLRHLPQFFENEIAYKNFFLKFYPSSTLSIQQFEERLKIEISTLILAQGLHTFTMQNEASPEKTFAQIILWDYISRQSIHFSPYETAQTLLQQAIAKVNHEITWKKVSINSYQQEASICERLTSKMEVIYLYRQTDEIHSQMITKIFPSFTANKAEEMKQLALLARKMAEYNLDIIQKEGIKAFELLSNRYQLILLKHELERIQIKLPTKKKNIFEKIFENIQQELIKPVNISLRETLGYIREASEILEENAYHTLQKELEKWHKQTYLKMLPLPNAEALIKAGGAIAYIYQDYLKQSFTSYKICIDFYSQSENQAQAQYLYLCFLQNRNVFENYYVTPLSYKNKWDEVVRIEIVAALRLTQSLSRVFDNPDGLPWVLIPYALLSLREKFADLAQQEGEKTDSIFITEQIVFQKILKCFQEQFFQNSNFFSNFFKDLYASFGNDETAYLQFLSRLFEKDNLLKNQILHCEENIKITMITKMLLMPLYISVVKGDASDRRKLAAIFLWSDVATRYTLPKLIEPIKSNLSNNEPSVKRVEVLLEETIQSVNNIIAQGKTAENYYQHEIAECHALNIIAERVYPQTDNIKIPLIAKTFPSFEHVKYQLNSKSGEYEIFFENEKDLLNAELMEVNSSHFSTNHNDFSPVFQKLLSDSEHYFEPHYHTWVRFLIHPLEEGQFDNSAYPLSTRIGFESCYLHHHYFQGTYAWKNKVVLCGNKNRYFFQERKNHMIAYRIGDNLINNSWVMMCTKTLRHLVYHRIPHCTAKEILLLATALRYAYDNKEGCFNEPFSGAVKRWCLTNLYHIEIKSPPANTLQTNIVYIYSKDDTVVYSVKSPDGQDVRDFPLEGFLLLKQITHSTKKFHYWSQNIKLGKETQREILYKISENGHIPGVESFYEGMPNALRPFTSIEIQILLPQLPLLVHNLIVKNNSRRNSLESQHKKHPGQMSSSEFEQKKTNIIIDHIHDCIAQSSKLFKEYCDHIINKKSLEPQEIHFLVQHFFNAYEERGAKLEKNLFIYMHDVIVQNKEREHWDEKVYGKDRLTEQLREQRKIETDNAIKKMHESISKYANSYSTQSIFKAYCHYLICVESIEPEESLFLANNLPVAYKNMDTTSSQQKMFNYVRPECERQIVALEQEWVRLSTLPSRCMNMFFQNKVEEFDTFYKKYRACYLGFKVLIQSTKNENNYHSRLLTLENELMEKFPKKFNKPSGEKRHQAEK